MVRLVSLSMMLALAACDPVSMTGAWCQYPADCHRPNVCSFNRCRPPCTLDSDCPSHRCIIGGPNGCVVEQDRGCATLGNACASALVCAEDQCSVACTSAASCPSDGICRRASGSTQMICADPSEVVGDAGPIGDAGR